MAIFLILAAAVFVVLAIAILAIFAVIIIAIIDAEKEEDRKYEQRAHSDTTRQY